MNKIENSRKINFLFILWKTLSKKRKNQLVFISFSIIISGITEIFTLSSIQPLLKVISTNDFRIQSYFLSKIYYFLELFFSVDQLIFIFFVFIIFLSFSTIIRLLNIFLINFISALIGNEIGTMAFKSSLTKDYKYHLDTNSSNIISTIVTKSNSTVDTIKSILNIFTSLVILVAILTTLININPQITIFSIISISAIYFLISVLIKNRLNNISQARSELIQEQTQSLQEGLGFIKDIILDKCAFFFVDSFRLKDKKLRVIDAKSDFLASSPKFILELIAILFLLFCALFFASNLKGKTNIFSLLGTIAFGMQRLLPLIQQIYASYVIISTNKESVINTLNLISNEKKSKYAKSKRIYNFKSKLELIDIGFKYSNEKDFIIKDFNLKIFKGEKIGVVGKSGCGKSTLGDILMGLLKPSKGIIKVDNHNLYSEKSSLNIDQWHSCISHVPQDVYLSDSSIAANIAFGVPIEKIDMKKLNNAIKEAQLETLIKKSRMGVFSNVGENGAQLSGGQKQRIGIARAIYKGGNIIILDEATSSLDSKTELSILNCIDNLSRDYTIIIISHRESTLGFCDRVINLSTNIS